MHISLLIVIHIVVAIALTNSALVSADNSTRTPTEIVVTTDVATKNPERFGDQWQSPVLVNNLLGGAGSFEPTTVRWKGRVVEGGSDFFRIEHPDWFMTRTDGFFDGGQVRVYRITDGEIKLIRTDSVKEFRAEQRQQVSKLRDSQGEYVFTGNTFIDNEVTNGRTYYYRVYSVNKHNKRTKWNNSNLVEVSATPNSDLAAPPPTSTGEVLLEPLLLSKEKRTKNAPKPHPVNVTATAYDGSVALQWGKAASDVVGYKVERLTRAPGRMRDSVQLSSSGPMINKGDYWHIDLERDHWPTDKVWDRTKHDGRALRSMNAGPGGWGIYGEGEGKIVHHEKSDQFKGAGKSYLLLDTSDKKAFGIAKYFFNRPGNGFYPYLRPKKQHRLDVWLRRKSGDGRVRMYMTGSYSSVDIEFSDTSDDWTKHSYEFSAPKFSGAKAVQLKVELLGGGEIHIDNLRLYETEEGQQFGQTEPQILQSLSDFNIGSIRTWAAQLNRGGGATLEHATDDEDVYQNYWDLEKGSRAMSGIKWPTTLAVCEQTGAYPWLVVSTLFSEQEWKDMIDYLAGGADTKYGRKRISQRGGNTSSWVDEFDKIYIEFGNEIWNARLFAPQSYRDPQAAGKFFEYYIQQMKSTSTWKSHPDLEDKIKFIANGWSKRSGIKGFGAINVINTPSAGSYGIALYNGGWEANYSFGDGELSDAAFQDVLTFGATRNARRIDEHAKTREHFKSEGHEFSIAIYEGGPGYSLPRAGKAFDPVAESYGKSLASAVSTFDGYMYALFRGFGPISLFKIEPAGVNWSSFAEKSADYRPHAPWLALKMRNTYAAGDMLVVRVLHPPVQDLPDPTEENIIHKDFPMISSYAFRDQDTYTVFIVSRRLDKSTPVELRLPFTGATGVREFTLTGEPRTSNIDEHQLKLVDRVISDPDLSESYFQFSLPASSIFGYQFSGVEHN